MDELIKTATPPHVKARTSKGEINAMAKFTTPGLLLQLIVSRFVKKRWMVTKKKPRTVCAGLLFLRHGVSFPKTNFSPVAGLVIPLKQRGNKPY
jgi:hypothetical protein